MSDLTNRIKAKYPQYANVDDATLEQKVIAKYPQYATAKPQTGGKSVSGFVDNVATSGANAIGQMASGVANVFNPDPNKNTLANTARLVQGGIQKLDPTEGNVIANTLSRASPIGIALQSIDKGKDNYEPIADSVGQAYKARYGGFDKIKDTAYNDPVGTALDASALLTGAGGLLKSGLVGGGRVAQAGSVMSKVGSAIDPISQASKLVTAPVNKALSGLAKEAENLPTRGMGNPVMLKNAKGVSPLPINELFDKYKTWDRSKEAFGNAIDTARAERDMLVNNASKSGSSVNLLDALKSFDDQIAFYKKSAATSDSALAALQELQRRKAMFVQAMGEGSIGVTPLKLNPSKVNSVKNSFQSDVPKSDFGKSMAETNTAVGTKSAYKSLIGAIEQAIPGTKKLGREESALRKLQEIATSQESRGAAKQNINFSRLGSAGLGGLVAGVPGAISGYFLEQAINSPQFLKYASKAAGKAGKAQPKVNNIFKAIGKTGKVIRLSNPDKK